MTLEDLVRSLVYRQAELQTLSDALGADIIAGLAKNQRLDDPEQAFRLRIRSVTDHAIGLIVTALIYAKEPQVAATMDAKLADLEGDTSG